MQIQKPEREIILDTETTGLDPKSGHRIIEIGALEMYNRVLTGNEFQTYINPQRDVPAEAYRVHGIGTDFLKDFPLFEEIAQSFLEFIGDSKLVIHNAPFDIKFLNYELSRAKHRSIDMSNVIDTLPMARKKFPGAKANLDALCKRFKIDNSARTKHGALVDCELLSEVYVELTGGRQGSFFSEPQAVAKNILVDSASSIKESRPSSRNSIDKLKADKGNAIVIKASSEEKSKHTELMKRILESS